MRAFGDGLLAHEHASGVEEGGVPGCSEGGAAGEAGGSHTVEEFGASHAIGAVGDADRGDAVLGEGDSVPPVSAWNLISGVWGWDWGEGSLTCEEGNLLYICEFLENCFYVYRGCHFKDG